MNTTSTTLPPLATTWRAVDPLGLSWRRRDAKGQIAEIIFDGKTQTWRGRWQHIRWFFMPSFEAIKLDVEREIAKVRR